jgi:hypothetical protein
MNMPTSRSRCVQVSVGPYPASGPSGIKRNSLFAWHGLAWSRMGGINEGSIRDSSRRDSSKRTADCLRRSTKSCDIRRMAFSTKQTSCMSFTEILAPDGKACQASHGCHCPQNAFSLITLHIGQREKCCWALSVETHQGWWSHH